MHVTTNQGLGPGRRKPVESIIVLSAVFVSLYLVSSVFLTYRQTEYIDDLGLFNPIYMFLHTGRMTYPIHSEFQWFTIHPPIHYLEIALLMKLGVQQVYANVIPGLVASILAILLVASSRMRALLKVAALCAFTALVLVGTLVLYSSGPGPGLRPDLGVAIGVALGLLTLETARIGGWRGWRLFVGAFFLTYGSALHWIAVPGCLGVAVYVIWAWLALPRARAVRATAALLCGGLAFGVPYLSLYIIPHWQAIWTTLHNVGGKGVSWSEGIANHMKLYRETLAVRQDFPTVAFWHVKSLVMPFYAVPIPVFLLACFPLCMCRQTRALFLAALPVCVTILLVIRKWPMYLLPETFIFHLALGVSAGGLVSTFLRRRAPSAAEPVAAGVVLCMFLPFLWPAAHHPSVARYTRDFPRLLEASVARAAGQSVLGNNALVGGRLGLWHASGAHHWYDISPDLLWAPDLSRLHLPVYFSRFDAIVEHAFSSELTSNAEHKALTSWYADRTLALRGFYQTSNPHLAILFLSAVPQPVTGYAMLGQTLWRFDSAADGPYAFLSMICRVRSPENPGETPFYELTARLKAWSPLNMFIMPRLPEDDGLGDRALITALYKGEDLSPVEGCDTRDTVFGHVQPVDLQNFLTQAAAADRMMNFDRASIVTSLPPGAANGTVQNTTLASLPPEFTVAVPGALPLEAIALAYDKASITGTAPVRIQTAPQQWAYAASIPIRLQPTPQRKRLIHIRGKVWKGQIGIGIANRLSNDFQSETFLHPTRKSIDYYIPIPRPETADALVIRNASPGGTPSEMTVEATEILAPAHSIASWARLHDISLLDDNAAVQRGPIVTVTTAPQQWSYAAAIPLYPSDTSRHVVLKVRAQVLSGEIGFGILAANAKHFISEQRHKHTARPVDILLSLLDLAEAGSLVIHNTSPNAVASQVILESIETWQLD